MTGLRNRALLSLAYYTGLRASELVAVQRGHVIAATDPEARLLTVPRSKGESSGDGATASLSPGTVRAVEVWAAAAGIAAGLLFRCVIVRQHKALARVPGRDLSTIAGREIWELRKTLSKLTIPSRARSPRHCPASSRNEKVLATSSGSEMLMLSITS